MEKIKEQWRLSIDFKAALRHLFNFIIGCFVVSMVFIALSFIVGFTCAIIVKFFKYGYGLW
jgi:glucan phosphoethanolaminetransferase (alkaline phosphatase superfamily)